MATVIPLKPSRYAPDHPHGRDHWEGEVILDSPSRHNPPRVRLGIGYFGPNGQCRRRHGGPMVPGPYAYTYALPWVIAATPIPDPTPVITVEVGDQFVIDGLTFTLTDDESLADPTLTLADANPG